MTTTLHDKIAKLPSNLLPRVEQFIDSLPDADDEWELQPVYDENGKMVDMNEDDDWEKPLYDESGKKVHPKAGCLKGLFMMHDNFFEPDEDDWDQYV